MVGLMLARFMWRAPEIGVRRALGASRGAIYRQFLTEAAAIGLAGGVLGLLLTALGMAGIDHDIRASDRPVGARWTRRWCY